MDNLLKRAETKRIEMRAQLNPLFLPIYDLMCDSFSGTYWFPYKGLRTMAEQAELFGRGRDEKSVRAGERIVTYAMPGSSPHNYGCATDWVCWQPTWGPKEIWEKSDWEYLGNVAEECGAVWGGNFKKFPDKPHVELPITGGWAVVGDEYRKNGQLWIQDFIASRVKKLGGKL